MMTLRNIFKALLGVSILFVALGAEAQLTNPGFESGDDTGWTVSVTGGTSGVGMDGDNIPEGSWQPAYVNVRNGSYAVWAAVANSNGEFLSLTQTVNVPAGQYSVGFFLGLDQPVAVGIDQAISDERLAILIDGSLQSFDERYPTNNFPIGSEPSDFYEFSTLANLNGEHTIEFRISGSGTGRGALSADDFFVGEVSRFVAEPVPTFSPWSLWLIILSIGLFGVAQLRRKAIV